MSLSRKFHKRTRVDADTRSQAVGGRGSAADDPVASVEEDKGYSEAPYTPVNPSDYNDNEFYYENPSQYTPLLKVPPYVPDQPVTRIPDFSDSDEEAEFTAKVEAYYQRSKAERGKAESARLTAPKRDITEVTDDDVTDDDNVEPSGDGEDGEEAVATTRFEMIHNIVELLEMAGATLNFLVRLRGIEIDPTDLDMVKEALIDYYVNEYKPFETRDYEEPDVTVAITEQLFNMPLREFLPVVYEIAKFRDDLDQQGFPLDLE
ncbi:hypothetical protein F4814DRAFT_450340 [Daldinia grandis]|nr:hypothetical protein F4814DRAFT_450340 [Daldinia grandis]